jgi:hypothetical protein
MMAPVGGLWQRLALVVGLGWLAALALHLRAIADSLDAMVADRGPHADLGLTRGDHPTNRS